MWKLNEDISLFRFHEESSILPKLAHRHKGLEDMLGWIYSQLLPKVEFLTFIFQHWGITVMQYFLKTKKKLKQVSQSLRSNA